MGLGATDRARAPQAGRPRRPHLRHGHLPRRQSLRISRYGGLRLRCDLGNGRHRVQHQPQPDHGRCPQLHQPQRRPEDRCQCGSRRHPGVSVPVLRHAADVCRRPGGLRLPRHQPQPPRRGRLLAHPQQHRANALALDAGGLPVRPRQPARRAGGGAHLHPLQSRRLHGNRRRLATFQVSSQTLDW